MGGRDIEYPVVEYVLEWENVGDRGGGGSRRGEATRMRSVIDGVNERQRMMGGMSRGGMCTSVAGVGVSVMK